MQHHYSSSRASVGHHAGLGILLVSLPHAAYPQAIQPAPPAPPVYPHIISVSPVELLYKTQLGYEHRLNKGSSLGLLGSYHYGSFSMPRGCQATGYYRYYLKPSFPAGPYIQLEASVLNFEQTVDIVDIKTKQYSTYEYRALSGGGGIGFGYRVLLLRKATGGHLLGNMLLGFRGHPRPQPTYDTAVYRREQNFLGPDFNWYMGFSPGSIVHGLLALEYQL